MRLKGVEQAGCSAHQHHTNTHLGPASQPSTHSSHSVSNAPLVAGRRQGDAGSLTASPPHALACYARHSHHSHRHRRCRRHDRPIATSCYSRPAQAEEGTCVSLLRRFDSSRAPGTPVVTPGVAPRLPAEGDHTCETWAPSSGLLETTWSNSQTDGYYVCVSWRTVDCVYRLSGDGLSVGIFLTEIARRRSLLMR